MLTQHEGFCAVEGAHARHPVYMSSNMLVLYEKKNVHK